jgi:hypothetical protein
MVRVGGVLIARRVARVLFGALLCGGGCDDVSSARGAFCAVQPDVCGLALDGGWGDGGQADGGRGDGGMSAGPGDGGGSDGGVVDGGTPDAGQAGSDAGGDAGTSDAGALCDVVSQTGCAAGDKCALGSDGGNVCVAQGTVTLGESCSFSATSVDDCVGGEVCVAETASVATCHEFCTSDSDCTQPAVASGGTAEPSNVGHCLLQLGQSAVSVCTVACNPVTAAGASGCAPGTACAVGITSAMIEVTDCEAAGMGAEGATCTFSRDCAPGLACIDNGATSHCRQVCRTGVTSDCSITTDVCFILGASNLMFGACCPAAGC